jgi:hypothetical protein
MENMAFAKAERIPVALLKKLFEGSFMKKAFSVIAALAVLSGVSLNAQTTSGDGKQNYLFVDLAPLLVGVIDGGWGIGVGYERAVMNNLSIAGYFDYLSLNGGYAFDALIRPRFYPFGSAVNGLFAGGMLGYGMGEVETYGYYGDGYESFSAFTIGVEAGWKFVSNGGFAVEPWLGYVFGGSGGFKIGVTFGAAWGGEASPPRSRNVSTEKPTEEPIEIAQTAPAPVARNRTTTVEVDGIEGAIYRAAGDLIDRLPDRSKIAVLSISSRDRNSATFVMDELEFQLVDSSYFTIVDRKTLDQVRSEQNFQSSGDVDDNSAVSMGKMLGADIVITGSISGTGSTQRLTLKALNVQTAEIVTMVRESF